MKPKYLRNLMFYLESLFLIICFTRKMCSTKTTPRDYWNMSEATRTQMQRYFGINPQCGLPKKQLQLILKEMSAEHLYLDRLVRRAISIAISTGEMVTEDSFEAEDQTWIWDEEGFIHCVETDYVYHFWTPFHETDDPPTYDLYEIQEAIGEVRSYVTAHACTYITPNARKLTHKTRH